MEPCLHVCASARIAAAVATITAVLRLELSVLITTCGSPESMESAATTAAAITAASSRMISRSGDASGDGGRERPGSWDILKEIEENGGL